MLTPRQRKEAKQQADIERKLKAQQEHPEWYHTNSKLKKLPKLLDKATPIYKPEKLGKTPTTRVIGRYHKTVRRGS